MAQSQPGAPTEASPTGTRPESFGPFRIVSALASGGMGLLYRAVHRDTGQAVAIKTVIPAKESVVGGMRSEIRALARLVHPGVARIVAEGVEGGQPWYAMELVEGKTLARFRDEIWQGLTGADMTTDVQPLTTRPPSLAAPTTPTPVRQRLRGPRPQAAAGRLDEVLTIIQRLCAPLAHVHGRGIVHRDLKPENVLLKPDGTPVLIDFGVASRFPAALAREILEPSGTLAGTLAYMAPEQFRRGVVDARADLYSLGCVLYELVCGRRPFLGGSSSHLGEAHLHEPPLPPSRLVDEVPPALEALILKLLAKRPRERLGYAADVEAALTEILRPSGDARPARLDPLVVGGSGAILAGRAPPAREPGGDDGFYLYRPEMIGRKGPAERLFAATSGALSGRGAIFFLGGESGIGKTMLASEAGKQAAALGMRVVTGDCVMLGGTESPETAGSPLAPFRRLLQTVADHCRARGPDTAAQLFGPQGALLAKLEPSLEDLPGLAPRPPEADLTGEAARSATLTATAHLITAFSREQPLLLVLDDLQWADELSLAVLKLLPAERLATLPLLILATYRTDEAPADLRELIAAPGAQDLRLGRLDEEGVATMVTEMLGMSQPPAALVRFLARTSEGNPFFVAEYMRAAVGDGVLYRHRGNWQLARGMASNEAAYEALTLPNSLRGLVRRRLLGLAPPVAALLEVAAVIGRLVDEDLLQTASAQEPTAVHDALAELLARQVLEVSGNELRFVHEKLREHAYDSIEASDRQRIHLRVAEAIERATPHAVQALAYHFHAGGKPERALRYAILAGRQAHSAGALHEAHDQLTRALRLEAESFAAGRPTPRLERARLRRLLGEARAGVGDVAGSEAILREGFALARGKPAPSSRIGWAASLLSGLAVQALHRLWPPRPRPRSLTRDAMEEAATIANGLGFAFLVQARHLQMLTVATLAANLAERAGAAAPRVIPYSILGSTLGIMGAQQLSLRYFEASREAVANARDLIAPLQQAQIEGFYYLNRGQWDAARKVLEPAFALGRTLGIPYEIEALGIARALLEMMTGKTSAARGLLAEVRRTAEGLGNRLHEWWCRRYEAAALLQEGEPRAALATVAPAEQGFRQRGANFDLINVLALRASAHQRLGEPDAALAAASEAHALMTTHPAALSHCYDFHCHVPEVLLNAWAEARARKDAAADELGRAAKACLRLAARYARTFPIGQPHLHRHRARAAEIEGQTREADRHRERAITAARDLGMPI